MIIAKELVSSIILDSVKSAIADGKIALEIPKNIKLEYPKEEKFGDYSTPFAMEAAKVLKRNPLETGEIIAEYIRNYDVVEKVEVVRPGFINIFISRKILTDVVSEVISLDDKYGRIVKDHPERVNIEFVSANPTGPLNIVSARAAAGGDTLANLLEAAGDSVDREFYINDYGNQVRLLGESVLARYLELAGDKVEFPEDGYRGEYIKDIAAMLFENHRSEIDSISEHSAKVEHMAMLAIKHNVSGQQKVMENFKVKYDQWFSERTLHEAGAIMDTFRELEAKGVIYEEEGKKIFRSTDFGDDKDRVVIRDDGRATYLLADIAYHRNKFSRGYTKIIDIWGPDHHGYIDRLKGAVDALGYEKGSFKVLISQQVNLIMNGELVKMSKRLGQFSTMSDLIEEIGVDVARYFFVMRSMDSHLDFDLALAKKESSENPVFYLQYAYARVCAIFREAANRGISFSPGITDNSVYDSGEAISLLKMISRYPEEIKDAAEVLEPHRIANYLLRLAQSFHRFYTENRVLTDDVQKTISLMTICLAVKTVMRNGLKVVGVDAPEKM